MKCNISSNESNSGVKGDVILNTDEINSEEVTLVEVTFPPDTEARTITYTLLMEFPDTNENQNAQQGKEFHGTLFAELGTGEGLYYTHLSPDGTPTKPNSY